MGSAGVEAVASDVAVRVCQRVSNVSVVAVVVVEGSENACTTKAAGPAVSVDGPIVQLQATNGVLESTGDASGENGAYV